MATQKNLKSKATASKAKSAKVATGKKQPSKAKPAAGKSKLSAKTAQASKGKKTITPSKARPAVKAKAKPVVQKQAPKAPLKKAKPAPAPKSKAVKAKPVPKKVTRKTAAKAAPKPKSKAVAKSSKPAHPVKVKALKPVVKKTAAPVKTALKTKGLFPQKPQAKPVMSKGPAAHPAKVIAKSGGSKMTDAATKPSVSSKPNVEKSKEPQKTTTPFRPAKSIITHPVKSNEKMSEKKHVAPTAYAEEPQKTRYNDKELEEFDQLIDQKLIVAREQLEFYLKQLEDMAENPDNKIKGLDDGLSTLESERVSSMAARQQKLIQHLENAKIRIKNKVYGICRETGKLISKERLRAVPHATLSIEAKQAQN